MGFLETIEGLAGEQGQGNNQGTNANLAGGIIQALEAHPSGLSGIIDSFRNNGMADHVQNWSSGQQPSATPDQIQQGLSNTGFIENVATKAGVSREVAKVAIATALPPMILAHFTNGGQQAPPQGGYGGVASQLLGKFI